MKRFFAAVMAENIWIRLLFFGILTVMSLILFSLAGQLLAILLYGYPALQETLQFLRDAGNTDTMPDNIPGYIIPILYITQISSQAAIFLIPTILYIWLMRKFTPQSGIWGARKPAVFTILMTFAVVVLSLPLVSWLTEINLKIPLPEMLVHAEENAGALLQLFFGNHSKGRFLLNLLMIAVIPAVGEELFFRGILQEHLRQGFRNTHLAVVVTALAFSFFHFQFQGFIPRFFLGLLFGYLMVWSGSIWVPVLAHFINNGSAVLVEFLAQKGVLQTGYEEFGQYSSMLQVMLSITLTGAICYLIYFYEKPRESFR